MTERAAALLEAKHSCGCYRLHFHQLDAIPFKSLGSVEVRLKIRQGVTLDSGIHLIKLIFGMLLLIIK